MRLEHPTARKIWVHLVNLFTGNKSNHVVHLEYELHNLVQGKMFANDFCHWLHQLTNSLTDCDAPVSDQALVHQLIHSLNNKFSVLKMLLPLLPKFPSFVEARELILTEEASREADNKHTTEIALLAADAASQKADSSAPPPMLDRVNTNNTNTNNNFYGSRGRGYSRAVATVGAVAASTTTTITMLHSGLPPTTGGLCGQCMARTMDWCHWPGIDGIPSTTHVDTDLPCLPAVHDVCAS
jgi:hypothetical protein